MASLIIKEPDKEPRTLILGSEPLVIGRSQSRCTLTFDFLGLSAKHCEIVNAGETFKIVDLDSANHTFVNNKEIVEHYLNHGDRIALGVIILTFNNEGQKQPPPRAGAKPRSSANAPAIAENSGAPSEPFKEPTFIMDGEKLRKKMDMLRSGKIESLKDVPPTEEGGPKQSVGGTAKDYAKAAEADDAKAHTDFRWLFFALGFFIAVALSFSLGMLFKVLKF
jgi:pSer/pThr/pTyr-binding forkhead associated (FHA) protein